MSHTLSMLAQDRQVEPLREADQFRRDRPAPARGSLDARRPAPVAATPARGGHPVSGLRDMTRRLRARLRLFAFRGQLGPTREQELFEFLPTRSVAGR